MKTMRQEYRKGGSLLVLQIGCWRYVIKKAHGGSGGMSTCLMVECEG